MKRILSCLLLSLCFMAVAAQRTTDPLDRGLVAVKKATGVFCSWRILAEEYYDVTYNIYRNGTKLNAEPLTVSNYTDASGSESNTYTVRAVVNGVEQADSKVATVWATGRVAGGSQPAEQPNHLSIQMADVVDRNGNIVYCSCGSHTPSASVAQNYTLNDCSVADIDGDGEVEILVKRINASDASSTDTYAHNGEIYSTTNTRAFVVIEAYKLNGKRLWWIDCGPNMVSMNSTEINVVAYDWDEDGKAEVLMRGADNMIIHMADGTTYNVGNMSKNYRSSMSSHSNPQYAWTKDGDEFLLYLNGATAKPYSITDYPLKRVESGETLASAWSEGNTKQAYGHRSSKYFFGAPVLDGRKASIFLARGIYTQTKMIALDVNPTTHEFTTKWTWKNNTPGSEWYGQGNHNINIADVDGDGCDEIVYGSMVIDNNGKGLSTTGLGHGDALHTGDLDPFRKGMETFACNEDHPGNNYRNAATCEIYYRHNAASDDGRAMAGNFSNDYPGSIAASVSSPVLSLTKATAIDGLANECFGKPWHPMSLNGLIYWDGDLCAEAFDSPGTESEGVVSKLGNRIMQSSGCKLNNDSKNNPCFQGDILGDWREELILRTWDNNYLRVLTTTEPTNYRIPSLWFDPEYRQAMVWQMCAYNQPPHPSFFLGEMEGITAAPPALTNRGKEEITVNSSANATINNSVNGKDMLVVVEPIKSYNKRYAITLDGSVAPKSLTVNAPVIVSGNNDNNNITSTAYSCNISYTNNGTFSGSMRLIKQGEGNMTLPNKTMTYTGQTDVWEGTVTNEKGTISNSKVWMNRHTTLNTTSGSFKGGIEMNYNSTFNIGTSANVGDLKMNYGSRIVLDHVASTSDAAQNTQLNITGTLSVDKKDWQYGPEYLAPVLKLNSSSTLAKGSYKIGTLANVDGDLNDIILEGSFASGSRQKLVQQDGDLILKVYDPSDDYVGSIDNSTGWWTAFSDSYLLKEGFKANIKFKNYGSTAQNYYNWLLVAANGTGHSTTERSDYSEYFVLRADNYGWGNYYNAPTLSLVGGTLDWNNFRTDMAAGADVDMNVSMSNNVIKMDAVITAPSGRVYNYTFTSKTMTDKETTLFFTVENAHITNPVVEITPLSSVKMTYVDYNNPTTSYGELEQVTAGYNNISGGNVGFANSGWGVNKIVYVQLDLSNYKKTGVSVSNVAFTMQGSGSTDSNRNCGYGIGYNNSAWSGSMTYNSADKSITTIGDVLYTTNKSSSVYKDFSWDITDVFNNDADGIITLLVYENQAAGGYVKEPGVSVKCSVSLEEGEPVHVHSYVYTDNGDGTHNRVCSCGESATNETHTGECTGCNIYWLVDGTTYTNNQEKQYGKVTYTRALQALWNPVCVPFSINVDDYLDKFDVAEIFAFCPYVDTNGDKEVTAEDDDMLIVFKKTSGLTVPGKPYLFRPKESATFTINAADGKIYPANAGSVSCATTKNTYTITGLYSTVTATADNNYYYMGANGLSHRTSGSTSIKPNRWYMTIKSSDAYASSASSAKSIGIFVLGEDDMTGVNEVRGNGVGTSGDVQYMLDGRKVNGNGKLPSGIYIKNGKKIFVK